MEVNPLCAAVRRRTAWIAVVAILLGALLPSMSHGVPSQDVARTFVRVGTAAGMKLSAVDGIGRGPRQNWTERRRKRPRLSAPGGVAGDPRALPGMPGQAPATARNSPGLRGYGIDA